MVTNTKFSIVVLKNTKHFNAKFYKKYKVLPKMTSLMKVISAAAWHMICLAVYIPHIMSFYEYKMPTQRKKREEFLREAITSREDVMTVQQLPTRYGDSLVTG